MEKVAVSELLRVACGILLQLGVPAADAELAAASIVKANACGVESHGLQLLPVYAEQLASGRVDARATGHIVSEQASCIVYDGENGLGQTVAARCCIQAVRVAKAVGIGFVVARRSNHFGRAEFWGARILRETCIGIVLSNASPLVAPWQGREPRIGTNPICIAAPGGWLLDMATTAVAAGKIVDAALEGRPTIPEDWALNSAGKPTTVTRDALQGTPLPLGGSVAGHKGTGLAVAVEILSSVLSRGAIGSEVGSLRSRAGAANVSHTFVAIDVERFMPLAEFESRVRRLVEMLKAASPAPGFQEVLVAGEREARLEERRLREGIPVTNLLWTNLLNLSDKYGVARPQAL